MRVSEINKTYQDKTTEELIKIKEQYLNILQYARGIANHTEIARYRTLLAGVTKEIYNR